MRNRIITLIIGLFAILTISAKATVIVTYAEKAGSETSSIVNSSVLTFDNIATGYHTSTNDTALTWAGVGTFDNLNIVSAGPYGGANNTNYMVVGVDVNTKSTLTLNTPSSYFGFWWSAGDKENVLDFYSGANGTGNLVAQFTTTNLLKTLPKSYYGNPNSGYNEGKDAGEPFAFINFFGTTDTSWKSIVIKNSLATGFEADNFTSRVEAYLSLIHISEPTRPY